MEKKSILTLWWLLTTLSGWKHIYLRRGLCIQHLIELDAVRKVQSVKELVNALTVNCGKMMGEFDAFNYQVQGVKTEAASSWLFFKAFASTRKAILFIIIYGMGRETGFAIEIGSICGAIVSKQEPGKSKDNPSQVLKFIY